MSEMREPTFLILSALAGGRLHGYGIITAVADLSDGGLKLAAGTLYAALDRLAESGEVVSDGDEVVDGRMRRYFVLTPEGATGLHAEAQRRAAGAQRALQRLANLPDAVATEGLR